MQLIKKIVQSNFFIKLTNWEYWPFGILQFPVFVYYGLLSLKARSFLFFTASNPGIPMGGMFGESKFEILQKIPPHLIPKTTRIDLPASTEMVLRHIHQNGYQLPVIFKPDLGERGFMVRRIYNESDITKYLQKIRISFVVQSLVDLPLEFGVLYHRHPSSKTGRITSIVMKEMLSVTGDGHSTLRELILAKPRAKLQLEKLRERHQSNFEKVVAPGEKIELVHIGNHALGTKFLNGNQLINDKLNNAFDQIAKDIEGFYFGRFDLRCGSVEDLYKGNVLIVELNGCGAEPAHIYDPDFKLVKAVAVLFSHWKTIFEISRENHKLGTPFTSLKEAKMYYKKFKEATR
jgi:hypothetical protein